MASKRPAAKVRQLQLRISLLGTIPLVWRSIVVPETITLPALHSAIQAVMGWHDSHLHEFRTVKGEYGNIDPDDPFVDDMKNERGVRLLKVLGYTGTLEYRYDFGDDWLHLLQLEDVLPATAEAGSGVRCIAGANACPPEDVGGIPGYQQFVEVIGDPSHEQYAETREWLGEDFDPKAFDLEAANLRLSRRHARHAWRQLAG